MLTIQRRIASDKNQDNLINFPEAIHIHIIVTHRVRKE